MEYTGESIYGSLPTRQPTATATADHAPGTPVPHGRTEARDTRGPLGNPVAFLVALVGLAILLTQVTVRGTLELEG